MAQNIGWLQKRVEEDMMRIRNGINRLCNKFSMDIHVFLDENHNVVRKYSLILLVYIVLTGGEKDHKYIRVDIGGQGLRRYYGFTVQPECKLLAMMTFLSHYLRLGISSV